MHLQFVHIFVIHSNRLENTGEVLNLKKWIARSAAIMAALMVSGTAAAAAPSQESLDDVVADFMDEYGLNSENFALSYYNTVTGEAYGYNDTHMMVAASTFKLPLNLYYYDLERSGELDPDAYIAGAGTTLSDAHYQSLVWSNNEVSIGLLYNLGDFRTYKERMRRYFTMEDEEIDYIYYVDNYYCTRMMIDALTYLYDNQEDFSEMIGYMLEAQPGEYFKAGVPEEYDVAHKYGWYEGAVNDVGIIYTPEPFLLVVYTQDVGAQVVADAAALCTDYNLAHTQLPEQVDEVVDDPEGTVHLEIEEVPSPGPEEIQEEAQQPEDIQEETLPLPEDISHPDESRGETSKPQRTTLDWWIPAAVLGVLVLLCLVLLLGIKRRRRHGKYEAARRK